MDSFFLIIVFVALAHFLYQGIVLPAVRMRLRFRIYALRDKLRHVKHHDGDGCDAEVYACLQSMLNNLIVMFADLDFGLLALAEQAMARDPALRTRAERRYQLVSTCENKDLQAVFNEARNIFFSGFVLNSAPLLISVIPLMPVAACYESLKESAKKAAKAMVSVPEGELPKIYNQPAFGYA